MITVAVLDTNKKLVGCWTKAGNYKIIVRNGEKVNELVISKDEAKSLVSDILEGL